MTRKSSEKHLINQIKNIIKPISLISISNELNTNIDIETKLIIITDNEIHLNDIDFEHLRPNELYLLKSNVNENNDQKNYAVAKLAINDSLTRGYFSIARNGNNEFSKTEVVLLNHFINLVTETIADYEEQEKLMNVFNDFVQKSVHDLKNPLTSISLTSELLKRKTDDPAIVMKFADKLENACKRLFENLDHLKSAFPADDQSFKLDIKEVNIGELLKEVVGHRAIPLVCNADSAAIYADANRLKQAFTNLIISIPKQLEQVVEMENGDNEIKITLKHHGLHHHRQTKFLIARTLIEMHKGKITAGDESYYISLPLTTP